MLRKLIKHELRATARVMGPMLLLMLGAAVGGNIAVHHLVESDVPALNVIGVFLLMVFVAAIIGTFVVSFVLMIQRFYQNLLRDEGYLMMTLPATVHEHVLSKLFVSILWAAATAIMAALATLILVFELEFVDLIVYDLNGLLAQLRFSDLRLMDYTGHAVLFVLEMALLMIAMDACLCLQIYAAMAVGHSFTHHKGLLSFAAYIVLCMLWNIVQNAALYLLGVVTPESIQLELNISPMPALHITLCLLIVCSMIPSALWYAITTYFLKNRLNLD